jgi:hypothetical protein
VHDRASNGSRARRLGQSIETSDARMVVILTTPGSSECKTSRSRPTLQYWVLRTQGQGNKLRTPGPQVMDLIEPDG